MFDRDLTPIIGRSHNKYVGTLLNIDPWAKETFDIKSTFSERKAAQGGIRETVHDYRKQPKGTLRSISTIAVVLNTFHFRSILDLVLKRNLYVMENRTLQLDYLVNDTTYPGLEGTVLLHFNITILPVHIHFANITHTFPLTRRASSYAQAGLL